MIDSVLAHSVFTIFFMAALPGAPRLLEASLDDASVSHSD
jgi:hypothetical protein